MRTSIRFTVAVHTVVMIAALSDKRKVNSEDIARSTGVNAVNIRRIFQALKQAGILSISPGPGGVTLARSADNITLYDLYIAVESPSLDDMFKFPQNPSNDCLFGENIYGVLRVHLAETVQLVYEHFSTITISMLLEELKNSSPEKDSVSSTYFNQN